MQYKFTKFRSKVSCFFFIGFTENFCFFIKESYNLWVWSWNYRKKQSRKWRDSRKNLAVVDMLWFIFTNDDIVAPQATEKFLPLWSLHYFRKRLIIRLSSSLVKTEEVTTQQRMKERIFTTICHIWRWYTLH